MSQQQSCSKEVEKLKENKKCIQYLPFETKKSLYNNLKGTKWEHDHCNIRGTTTWLLHLTMLSATDAEKISYVYYTYVAQNMYLVL